MNTCMDGVDMAPRGGRESAPQNIQPSYKHIQTMYTHKQQIYKEKHKHINTYKAYKKHQWKIPNIYQSVSVLKSKSTTNRERDTEREQKKHKYRTGSLMSSPSVLNFVQKPTELLDLLGSCDINQIQNRNGYLRCKK